MNAVAGGGGVRSSKWTHCVECHK